MRALKKAILSCMAVGALSTAVAASAFAASYADGKVSSEADLSEYAGQMTILVIEKGADNDGIQAEDILYIDQEENADGIFQNMGVRANYTEGDVDADGNEIKGDGTLKYGTYVVKIGGENVDEIITAEFTVGSNGRVIQLGEIDGDGEFTGNDALQVLKAAVGAVVLEGDALIAADCDLDSELTGNDSLLILKASVGAEQLGTVTITD